MKYTNDMTAEYVRSRLIYNPETGSLIWKPRELTNQYALRWNRHTAGTPAGCLGNGYVVVGLDGKLYLAHRLIWLIVTGEWPKEHIDHIDLDRANNVWANLREATASQNSMNQPKKRIPTTGSLKGISWNKRKRKWTAQIESSSARFFLGMFDSQEAAHEAYCAASAKLHGGFSRLT